MSTISSQVSLPVSPALQDRLNRRLVLLMGLPALDAQRRALHREPGLPDEAVRELARQVREKKRPPDGEAIAQTLAKLSEQIERVEKRKNADLQERDQMLRALRIGHRQATVIARHAELTSFILSESLELVADEPLLGAFRKHGVEADDLFAWTVYGKALDGFDHALQKRIEQSDDVQRGKLLALHEAVAWERRLFETIRTEAFWRCYEHAAALLVSSQLEEMVKPYVRCFLRHAHVIHAPWMIDEDVSHRCLEDCDQPVVEYDGVTRRLPVFFADEYIDLAAWGYITPSPDEDLELNGRNTETWKIDRLRRRWIHGQHTLATLQQRRSEILSQIAQLEENNQTTEQEARQIDRHDPQYHQVRQRARDHVQSNKVTIARLRRALVIIDKNKVPAVEENIREAREKLDAMRFQARPELLARNEARAIRRMCRLCAHLHEPFLPAQAAEAAWKDFGYLNDRDIVTEVAGDIERRDPGIFQWILAHSKKMENRVHVRQAPYLLIVPGSGQMALSINPRTGTEVGRLVAPQWNQRRDALPAMMCQAMADFRFDTSRNSGGVDWMHSDTLASSYATERWNYRKRSKDRRDKAGIDIHQTDRVNFRRHYQAYLDSADEGGRKLFYKCPEIYEAFLKFMMLPVGVLRCKKA